jgi:hypothetical protein
MGWTEGARERDGMKITSIDVSVEGAGGLPDGHPAIAVCRVNTDEGSALQRADLDRHGERRVRMLQDRPRCSSAGTPWTTKSSGRICGRRLRPHQRRRGGRAT